MAEKRTFDGAQLDANGTEGEPQGKIRKIDTSADQPVDSSAAVATKAETPASSDAAATPAAASVEPGSAEGQQGEANGNGATASTESSASSASALDADAIVPLPGGAIGPSLTVAEQLTLLRKREKDLLQQVFDQQVQIKALQQQLLKAYPQGQASVPLLQSPVVVGPEPMPGMVSTPSAASSNQFEFKEDGPMPDNLSQDPPSKVVHFRNFTAELDTADAVSLCAPFGRVVRVLNLRAKNQCLVEFARQSDAINFVNHYQKLNSNPTIRGRKVYARFSKHPGVTASNSAVGSILLVSLEYDFDPVTTGFEMTADMMYQVFASYGTVRKIVLIQKAGGPQCLVEFPTQTECGQAYEFLHGKTIYIGNHAISLKIQFSHLPELTVHQQTEKSRDYTQGFMPMATPAVPAQPTAYGAYDASYGSYGTGQDGYQYAQQPQADAQASYYSQYGAYAGYGQAYGAQQQQQQATAQSAGKPAGQPGQQQQQQAQYPGYGQAYPGANPAAAYGAPGQQASGYPQQQYPQAKQGYP